MPASSTFSLRLYGSEVSRYLWARYEVSIGGVSYGGPIQVVKKSVPGAVATGCSAHQSQRALDPVATAPGTDRRLTSRAGSGLLCRPEYLDHLLVEGR